MTVIKDDTPEEYAHKVENLRSLLGESQLSQGNMRAVEKLLSQNGADFFKIECAKNVNMRFYQ